MRMRKIFLAGTTVPARKNDQNRGYVFSLSRKCCLCTSVHRHAVAQKSPGVFCAVLAGRKSRFWPRGRRSGLRASGVVHATGVMVNILE